MSVGIPNLELDAALENIGAEVLRATAKFPDRPEFHGDRWSSIANEEFLEALKEHNDIMNEVDYFPDALERLDKELVQAGAMITRWLLFVREVQSHRNPKVSYMCGSILGNDPID